MDVTVLYRPVGQKELDLIAASEWRRFPPRLDWQPIFYPVLNEHYATTIARDRNTKDAANGSVGYVLRFHVDTAYLANFEVHQVGGRDILEYWIPAEELDNFNDHITGPIEIRISNSGKSPVFETFGRMERTALSPILIGNDASSDCDHATGEEYVGLPSTHDVAVTSGSSEPTVEPSSTGGSL